ncbi:MAG: ribonuclease HII [Bacteroidales bacterium]|nr:ribonuclease HII [Bacteroidales bacterium]MBO7528427.1 ribonuclease HII [Bacteroidales bacterium]MBQ3843866.1 ribonuclease HII [Bacteroidales bacterium]
MNLKPFYTENLVEAGCDEAGRGCIAGPVVAAAVILPRDMDFPEFDDSKKLTEKQREKLRIKVLENAVAYGVGIVSAEEIDEINILNASFLAMHRAIDQLTIRPELLLIDGNRFNKYHDIKHQCIVGGDAKYQAIAAASILAKTTRDHIMQDIDNQYPVYNWKQNKGYPTIEHKNAVAEHGMSPYHRKTFNMSIQLKLF